uniref:Putative signal peptidase complex subunit 1 n=1 Tax=Davidia involucrata TaxID=16924 RepID=A0A5B7BBA4_DAVIN
MANDATFRSSLVWLAATVVLIGLYTQSLKKMFGTYLFGMFAIAGVLLPDWDFFDRDVSQWFSPLYVDDMPSHSSHRSTSTRFRFYPVRLVVYTTVYVFALYKWWIFISN